MAYQARVITDSISETGCRLTTMVVTFPRLGLAEFNTHRVFSRNSASSRAIPISKQLEMIEADPFIPTYWGAKQAGMQAEQEVDPDTAAQAEAIWREGLEDVTAYVRELDRLGVHKQLPNRLLEPFMWQTVVVTATEWSNFFALRASKMAQPEIRTIAEMMLNVYNNSEPQLVKMGEWHLPFIQPEERDGVFEYSEDARKISAARSGRVSYLTHEGKRDLGADLVLFDRLSTQGHMSPLEHPATPQSPDTQVEYRSSNFVGWTQLRKFFPNEHDFSLTGNQD